MMAGGLAGASNCLVGTVARPPGVRAMDIPRRAIQCAARLETGREGGRSSSPAQTNSPVFATDLLLVYHKNALPGGVVVPIGGSWCAAPAVSGSRRSTTWSTRCLGPRHRDGQRPLVTLRDLGLRPVHRQAGFTRTSPRPRLESPADQQSVRLVGGDGRQRLDRAI